MGKISLIGISLFVVILCILVSLTNVMGYLTVQSSNQQIVHEEVNRRELLFQTIMDISNNKEIQRSIFKSQMTSGKILSVTNPVLTKHQLNKMYSIGLILVKRLSKVTIHSIIQRFQLSYQQTLQEISAIIKKDAPLNSTVAQILDSECFCENENNGQWSFPVRCTLLLPLMIVAMIFFTVGESLNALLLYSFGLFILVPVTVIAEMLQCWWRWW